MYRVGFVTIIASAHAAHAQPMSSSSFGLVPKKTIFNTNALKNRSCVEYSLALVCSTYRLHRCLQGGTLVVVVLVC